MKKTIVSTLALLAVLSIAGITFAAQPAAPIEEPVVATTAPATGDTAAPDLLNEIFQEPVEVVDCCKAECYDEWSACVAGCGSTACKDACGDARAACIAAC